ncbi:MAG: hypothetical protein HZA83_00105 [Thaumarchaeota archaeon]|nr:hypothetical protein [Nitrososphaerota archaeon]
MYRNTDYGSTTTDQIWLKGFFTDYITGVADTSSACKNTYYRVDTDGSNTESFATGTFTAWGRTWKTLGIDKNVLFTQDGNYALEFFSESASGVQESPRRINVLLKKMADIVDLSNFCQGIQDNLSLNANWSSSSTAEGVYKYRLYASTTPAFAARTEVFSTGSATSYSFNMTNINMQSCGDGKCVYGENCPADSIGCPFGQICTNGCQTQTSITFNQDTTTCTPGINKPVLDSQCQAMFNNSAYACIDGCVPTADNNVFSSPFWSTFPSNVSYGKCGDGYCDLNEFCPRDNVYCPDIQVCNYGCRQSTTDICGNGYCGDYEHCSYDNSNCEARLGTGYACLAGCKPTSSSTCTGTFVPKYKLHGTTSRNSSNPCGDGFCEMLTPKRRTDNNQTFSNGGPIDEYCPLDNRYCSENGFADGLCANGCRSPYSTDVNTKLPTSYSTLICGDGTCGIGENCPLDNVTCASGYACIAGCVAASGEVVTNPYKTRFDPTKGSYDGNTWFQLEIESMTGSRSLSAPISCEIDINSPFRIPYNQGRRLQRIIGSRSVDFNIPANAIVGGRDTNIIIDINTNPPSFMKGSLLQTFDIEGAQDVNFTTPATFKVDFNKQALPCWPTCTIHDANRVSLYRYNIDSNTWTKIPTIVDWDNNQMWADLNRI